VELKNLDHFRIKWFCIDEIRNLEEVQDKLPFIQGFSFGPFVPYYLYHFFHNIWDFYILSLVSNFVILFMFYIVYFFFLFSRFLPFDKDISSSSPPSFLIVIMFVFIFLVLIIYYTILIITGKHSRKLSWNRNEWINYEAFEYREKNWHIAGLIFFIIQTLSFLFIIGGLAFLFIKFNL